MSQVLYPMRNRSMQLPINRYLIPNTKNVNKLNHLNPSGIKSAHMTMSHTNPRKTPQPINPKVNLTRSLRYGGCGGGKGLYKNPANLYVIRRMKGKAGR